jgi:hypothetical protein
MTTETLLSTEASIALGSAESKVGQWSNSILIANHRDVSKSCTFRNHMRSNTGVYLLCGYMHDLAARDHEGFCWPSWRAISANASAIAEDRAGHAKHLGRSQIYDIWNLLIAEGIISRARRLRRHALRDGFIVHQHSEWAQYFAFLDVCASKRFWASCQREESEAILRRAERQKRLAARGTGRSAR